MFHNISKLIIVRCAQRFFCIPDSSILNCLVVQILLAAFIFSPKSAQCRTHQLSEIFIESSGNNQYEAKLKADEQGMNRALFLIADQMGIDRKDIKEVPYLRLKNVFKPVMIANEFSTFEKYNATVTYEYNKSALYQLLIDYGNSSVNDMFYEYLILPVFKQKDVVKIWQKEENWNDVWVNARDSLNQNKIIYPTKTLAASRKITSETIFRLTYDDYIEIFPNILFKKLMIVTSEYFTNRKTGEGLMKVDNYIITSDVKNDFKLESEYPISFSDSIDSTVDSIIEKTIRTYGEKRVNQNMNMFKIDTQPEPEITPIIMSFEVFNQEEMDLIVSKISKIELIDKFVIEHDYDTRYKIIIYTEASEFQLAEAFYLNGLSYKIHGSLYNLIDVKQSGS